MPMLPDFDIVVLACPLGHPSLTRVYNKHRIHRTALPSSNMVHVTRVHRALTGRPASPTKDALIRRRHGLFSAVTAAGCSDERVFSSSTLIILILFCARRPTLELCQFLSRRVTICIHS